MGVPYSVSTAQTSPLRRRTADETVRSSENSSNNRKKKPDLVARLARLVPAGSADREKNYWKRLALTARDGVFGLTTFVSALCSKSREQNLPAELPTFPPTVTVGSLQIVRGSASRRANALNPADRAVATPTLQPEQQAPVSVRRMGSFGATTQPAMTSALIADATTHGSASTVLNCSSMVSAGLDGSAVVQSVGVPDESHPQQIVYNFFYYGIDPQQFAAMAAQRDCMLP